MKKQILFFILEQYADWEGAYLSSALYMLGDGQYEVKTVSLTADLVTSIGGFRAKPDYDIDSMPSDYEALILVGECPGGIQMSERSGLWWKHVFQTEKYWAVSAMLLYFSERSGC